MADKVVPDDLAYQVSTSIAPGGVVTAEFACAEAKAQQLRIVLEGLAHGSPPYKTEKK